MSDTMDDIHKGLLRKFHTLCGRLGMTEAEKRAIVESYGVESSVDIDTHDLIDICAALSSRFDGGSKEKLDKLRKRVMASIGGYLRKIGKESNSDLIKSIACRSTGYDAFNNIPASRLQNIYCLFLKKQKDIEAAENIAIELLTRNYTITGKSSSDLLN